MNQISDLRRALDVEAARLKAPPGLEGRVLRGFLKAEAATDVSRRLDLGGRSAPVPPPRLMALLAAVLAIAIVTVLVVGAHALNLKGVVPVKPGPTGGTVVHTVSLRPGSVEGVVMRIPIPLEPPAVLRCSAPPGTSFCSGPSVPTFTTQTMGWISAGTGGADGPTDLYRTDDRGEHWQAQLSWNYSGVDQTVVSPDGKQILIVTGWGWQGPAIFHSADAGSHWNSVGFPLSTEQAAAVTHAPSETNCKPGVSCETNPGYFPTGQIFFLNPREGWVMSQEPTYGVADLFHTTDSGAHWAIAARIDIKSQFGRDLVTGVTPPVATTPLPSGKGVGPPTADHELHGRISFEDSSTGWFLPDYSSDIADGIAPAPRVVYMTLDGGATWRRQTMPAPKGIDSGDAAVRDLKFFGDGRGVLELTGSANQSFTLYVSTTSDRGLDWSEPIALPPSFGLVTLIDFIDPQNWIASPWSGGLIRTTDAGVDWTVIPLAISGLPPTVVFELDFLDPSHGWALSGSGALFATSDAGMHWVQVNLPNGG